MRSSSSPNLNHICHPNLQTIPGNSTTTSSSSVTNFTGKKGSSALKNSQDPIPSPQNDLYSQSLHLKTAGLNIVIAGYTDSILGKVSYYGLGFLSLGLLLLLGKWFPSIPVWFYSRTCSLREASWYNVKNQYGQEENVQAQYTSYPGRYDQLFIPKIPSSHTNHDTVNNELPSSLKSVRYRFLTLVFDPIFERFYQLSDWQDYRWKDLSLCCQGLNDEILNERKIIFTTNEIFIPPKPYLKLLIDEVLHPIVIFQVFSIILWSFEGYYYYAASIFIIFVVSVSQTLRQTRENWNSIQIISQSECKINVLRNDSWSLVSSSDLVPGDIINLLTPGLDSLPCDSVLLQGDCIISESMLTGESIPVSKTPLRDTQMLFDELGFNQSENNKFSPSLSQSILFSGTQIISARGNVNSTQNNEVISMVIRTGFETTKGALVRSILFSRPSTFKFYYDSLRFIAVLALLALLGFVISLAKLIELKIDTYWIVIRCLDLVTIAVPPALPATMSVGLSFALGRLRTKGVFCITPTCINVAGKVNLVCFDKTGTLTEDDFDVLGAQQALQENHSLGVLKHPSLLELRGDKLRLINCLATCHGIKLIQGKLIGDPLDIRMFEATNWSLEEPKISKEGESHRERFTLVRSTNQSHPPSSDANDKPCELEIIRSFEFVSGLRRMSVLARGLNSSSVHVYTKGAPEAMEALCRSETIPSDYLQRLQSYTCKGYRVIACAGKMIHDLNSKNVSYLEREVIESDLTFLGFIIFENKLKPATEPTIKLLSEAKIRQVMCTGDNLNTAISVAQGCGLVTSDTMIFTPRLHNGLIWESINHKKFDHQLKAPLRLDSTSLSPPNRINYALAISGEHFRTIIDTSPKSVVDGMIMKTQIFARMTPEEKQELVERLQEFNYCVGFCGDGANDCGALKAADVGLSLSTAEASIATPFTSQTMDISSVPLLIKEGRAALVTSFSCFKYMGLYSIIQFATNIFLYQYGSVLGDFQFLVFDLFIILPIAVTMGRTQTSPILHPRSPTASLVSKKTLTSFIGQCVIQVAFQTVGYFYLLSQTWFIPPALGSGSFSTSSMLNTTLFHLSSYQYVVAAIVFSVGYPFRQSMFTNIPFIILLVVIVSFLIWIQLSPMTWQSSIWELVSLPDHFRYILLGISAINLVVSYVYERLMVSYLVAGLCHVQRLVRYYSSRRGPNPAQWRRSVGPAVLDKKFRSLEQEMAHSLSLPA